MKTVLTYMLLSVFAPIQLHAIRYPQWFLYPGQNLGTIAGFSYNGNLPLMDAEVMFCVYRQCEVTGYLETLSKPYINFLKNVQYEYVYRSKDFDWIQNKLFRKDCFVLSAISEDYVEAYSMDQKAVINNTCFASDSIPVPGWITNSTWEEGDYYYGVGVHTSLGNQSDCWKTSEEQAIYSILTSISMRFLSLNFFEYDSKTNIEDYTIYGKTEIRFQISSIETQERYPEMKNNLFYTLVRIRKNDIVSLPFDAHKD